MEAMHPVDEVPYEVCLDNHGCSDGPKTGRLMASNNVKLVLLQILAHKLVNCFIWDHVYSNNFYKHLFSNGLSCYWNIWTNFKIILS
jgi:hypothetical protein